MIVRYSPLVKYVAGRVSVGLPHTIEQCDLVSYGIFGLIDAIEKFDNERAIKFETYAITRIKGAIIDELRSIDWVPRSVRAKARAIEKAYAKLEAQLLRTPTDAEVARELGLSEDDLQAQFSQISFVGIVALDEVLSGGDRGESTTLGDTLADRREGPMAAFEVEEMKQILAGAINRLADREKIVLSLVLLRRPDPGRDRAGLGGHGEPGVPNTHQGRAPATRPDAGARQGERLGQGSAARDTPARRSWAGPLGARPGVVGRASV